MTVSTTDTPWIKATASGQTGGDCVEMRRHGHYIEVRDSKLGENGPVHQYTPAEWRAWLEGAKSGEFDHLA